MKIVTNIAGGLFGLAFIAFSLMFFFKMMPKMDPPPEGSAEAFFMGALASTGYLAFVKACELTGGILVAIPYTRNIGLLFLGPVLLNILAYHIFITATVTVFDPVLIGLCLLAAFLLWAGRKKFAGLLGSS